MDDEVVASLGLPEVHTDKERAWQNVKARGTRLRRRRWGAVGGAAAVCLGVVAVSSWPRPAEVEVSTGSAGQEAETGGDDGESGNSGPAATATSSTTTSSVPVDETCDVEALMDIGARLQQDLPTVLDPPTTGFMMSVITPESAEVIADVGHGSPEPCSILIVVERALTNAESAQIEEMSEGRAIVAEGVAWDGPLG